MITDEELAQLPEDPLLAFVEFEKIMRTRLYEAEKEQSNDQYADFVSCRLEYMNKVIAAAKEYGIEALSGIQVPSANSRVYETYKQFTSDVDHVTMQIRILNAPEIGNRL